MQALTAKQAKFVDEYLVDGNGARAAVAAGYGVAGARVRAHRLTRDNRAVQAEIAARQGVDSRRLQIERQDVIQGLLEAVQMARERQEPAVMVTSCRELGRMLGFYAPKSHTLEVGAVDDSDMETYQRMTDGELMRLAAEV
jgi:phage terminase small subunit